MNSGFRSKIKSLIDGIKSYGKRLNRILGWKFLIYLVFSQLILKGGLRTLIISIMLPIYRDSIDAGTLQLYMMLMMLPWALKPLLGLLSDLILLGGYKKRGWILIGCLLATGSAIALFFTANLPLAFTMCMMGIQFQIAIVDLLSEAKFSEIRQEQPELGSDASTLAQGLQSIGAIIVMVFIGILADAKLFMIAFIIIGGCVISPIVPTLLGWLPEIRVQGVKLIHFVDREQLYRDRWIIGVVAFCGVSSFISGAVANFANPIAGLVTAGGLLVCCLAGCWYAFPRGVTSVALYQVISIISSPGMGSAMDYYYTADQVCLPDGPHFSYAFYLSFTGIAGAIIALFGVIFYQAVLSKLPFRPVLIITTILGSLAGISDLIIIMRWNIALGISDKASYLLGEAILEPFIGQLGWIPVSALIALSVDPDMAASSFAFLAGISNFAYMTKELSGVIIYTAAGIVTNTPCNFDNLALLILMCHIVLPIMAVPAVFMIPNIRQDQTLDDAEKEEEEEEDENEEIMLTLEGEGEEDNFDFIMN